MVEKNRKKLNDYTFTVKVELRNVIKRPNIDGTFDYNYDIYVNGKRSSAYRDVVSHTKKDLKEVKIHAIERISRY